MISFDDQYAITRSPFSLESADYERDKLEKMISFIPEHPIDRAIDYGCGIGDATIALSERAERLISVDSSRLALRMLSARLRARSLHNISLRRASLSEPWPIAPSERAELIVASEVLYYLEPDELSLMIESFIRCLNRNAILITCHYRLHFHDRLVSNHEIHQSIASYDHMAISRSFRTDCYDLIAWMKRG